MEQWVVLTSGWSYQLTHDYIPTSVNMHSSVAQTSFIANLSIIVKLQFNFNFNYSMLENFYFHYFSAHQLVCFVIVIIEGNVV